MSTSPASILITLVLLAIGLTAQGLAYMSYEAVLDQVFSARERQQPKVLESLNRRGLVDAAAYSMIKRNYEAERKRMAALAPRLERSLISAGHAVSQNPDAPVEKSLRKAANLIAKTAFEDEFVLAFNEVRAKYKINKLVWDAWAIVFEERYLERDAQLAQRQSELAKLSKRIAAMKRDLEKQAAKERALASDPVRVAAAMQILSSPSSSRRQVSPSPAMGSPFPTAPLLPSYAISRPTVTQPAVKTAIRSGNALFRSDGSSTIRSGNSFFNSDGTSTIKSGNSYFHSDGGSTIKSGNSYFHSDGTTTTRVGNTFLNSDGSSTTVLGR